MAFFDELILPYEPARAGGRFDCVPQGAGTSASMRRACVTISATAFLLVGCGSEGAEPKDPEAALRHTLETYNAALADGDWETACAEMAAEFIHISREGMRENGMADPPEACPEMWERSVSEGLTDAQLLTDASEDARFDGAEVTGATARIDFSQYIGDGDRTAMTAYARRDDDGQWRITQVTN